MLQDALFLVKSQWRYARAGFVFTLVFYAVYGGIAGMLLNRAQEESTLTVMSDIILVTFMSAVGFIYSKGYLNNPYWRNDSFTKTLAVLRSLPIPVETLAWSRSIQILLISPISTIAFFGAFYAASDWAKTLDATAFIAFVLVWFAFGNVCSGWFVLAEWGTSGKRYLWLSIAAITFLIAAVVALALTTGQSIAFAVGGAMEGSGRKVWPLLALAAAALAHRWMRQRLKRSLLGRDFA
ncbi:hypothetical protein [Paenibacillus sp.]|uniref:hypothetical protein n=1 Tax=Paenibacillus sp. TaxID=58172 RepID=UPI002D595CE4|nr:hypothetical protein [Paenibacillus sp.]HZG88469.1 hypothetical protein [Paenibacillus sp.]